MSVPLSDNTIRIAIVVGIALSMFWYERRNLSPGGVIVPGIVALFLFTRPLVIVYSLVVAGITMVVISFLANHVILFGRRRFAALMLLSFGIAWAVEAASGVLTGAPFDFQVIGFIIPGLIANEMERQGTVQTLSTLAGISLATALVVFLLLGWPYGA